MVTERRPGTTRRSADARPARAGRLLGAGVLAALAVLGTGGCALVGEVLADQAPQPVRDASGAIVEEGDVDAMSLRVGDCVVADWDATSEETFDLWTVHVTPCASPHDSEVYAVTQLTAPEYPGEKKIFAEADQFCYDGFAAFIGLPYEGSELDFTYLYPTAESWAQLGDREVLCMANDLAGGVVGTLAKAQR